MDRCRQRQHRPLLALGYSWKSPRLSRSLCAGSRHTGVERGKADLSHIRRRAKLFANHSPTEWLKWNALARSSVPSRSGLPTSSKWPPSSPPSPPMPCGSLRQRIATPLTSTAFAIFFEFCSLFQVGGRPASRVADKTITQAQAWFRCRPARSTADLYERHRVLGSGNPLPYRFWPLRYGHGSVRRDNGESDGQATTIIG